MKSAGLAGNPKMLCDNVYTDVAILFEWDERKNKINIARHGIGFETAKLVFADPNVIVYPERNVDGEERWQAVGIAEGIVILTVSHTSRADGGNEVVRIISARKASRTERSEYDN